MVFSVLSGVGLAALIACSGNSTAGAVDPSGPTEIEPQETYTGTGPVSGIKVSASIASVTLGDDCGAGAGAAKAPAAGDCAPVPDAGSGDSGFAPGGCGGGTYCQQSNVQISFTAVGGSNSAQVQVVSVKLVNATTGALVDTLTAKKPQAWNGTVYAAWDQTIKPSSELKASYDLSAPSWNSTGSTDARGLSYSTKYRLHLTLRIDGVEFTLLSTELSREPEVAT